MEITTYNNKVITLNDSQELGLKRITNFINLDTCYGKLFFCLSGSAGAGKTTLIKQVLDQFGYMGVVVTGTTHKAKKNIQKLTGFESKTIHSILGLKPDMDLEEFNPNNIVFSKTDKDKICEYKIVFIDESSMLNKHLVEFIKQKAKQFDVKIIFIGDPRQLPPVKEIISLVFSDEEIEQYRLTKVERQQIGNSLYGLYDNLITNIDLIDNKKYNSIVKYEKISDFNSTTNEGYKFMFDSNEFSNLLSQQFQIGKYSDSKIMSWTNDRGRKWNNFIRISLFDKKIGVPLQVGEFLTSYRTVTDKNDYSIVLSENSAEYEVLDIRQGEFIEKFASKNDIKIKGFYVTLKEVDEISSFKKLFFLDKNDREGLMNFVFIEQSKLKHALEQTKPQDRGFAWKLYYLFRNQYYILGNILDNSGNVLVKRDFDYYYSITTHKAQGSTYENAFVDEIDINNNDNLSEQYRLKYVALSRPSKAAFILSK